jgi:hypothetical protein
MKNVRKNINKPKSKLIYKKLNIKIINSIKKLEFFLKYLLLIFIE